MKFLRYGLIWWLAYAGSLAPCGAQCTDMLRRAHDLFDRGHLDELPTVVTEDCIKLLTDPRDKEEARYLLVLSNLYRKNLDSAKVSMMSILRENPEYVCKARSPVAFQKYYETFRTNPVLILGGKAGINGSIIQSLQAFTTDEDSKAADGTYTRGIGFYAGGSIILPIWWRFDLIGELGLRQYSYEYKYKAFNFSDISFRERQYWLEMPLLVRFNFHNFYVFHEHRNFLRRVNPYLFAGGTFTYLLSSKAQVFRTDIIDGEQRTSLNKQVNVYDMRTKLNMYAVVGAGFEYKKGRAVWSLEARYMQGLGNVVKNASRYQNSDLLYSYAYTDSDMQFANLSFTAGFAYPIYRPKQKRPYYIEDAQPNTPEPLDE